jgi:hypothetical protein
MPHLHRAQEVDGGGQFGVSLGQSSAPGIQPAKFEMAVSLERCHPQFCSQDQSLSVSSLSRIKAWWVLTCIDLAHKPQAPRLMAAFFVGTIACGERQQSALHGP